MNRSIQSSYQLYLLITFALLFIMLFPTFVSADEMIETPSEESNQANEISEGEGISTNAKTENTNQEEPSSNEETGESESNNEIINDKEMPNINNDEEILDNDEQLVTNEEEQLNRDKKNDNNEATKQGISGETDKTNNTQQQMEYKEGDWNQKVVKLKKDLARLGFTVPGNGTNYFGKNTEKKVEEFQKYFGLNVTGTLNQQTQNKIDSVLQSPLQKGRRHQDTKQLKKNLAFLGMPVPGNGTTLYGTKTESTVKKFQKKYGLIINGIADEVTLAKINELKDEPLAKGMRRDDVKQLKKNLAKLGFTVPGNGTNYFGKNTEKKVEEFQKYFGLNVTGTLNQQTQNKIDSVLQSPLQKGKRHQDTKQLKKDFAFLDMPVPGNGTTYYGTKTESTVKKFQKKYGLIINGIADEVTLAKINELKDEPLAKGMRRDDVKQLKKDLAKLGFTIPGNGTNYFGKNTEKKVEEFQKYFGLNVTGTLNQQTQNKINSVLQSPLQKGRRHQDTKQLKKDLAFLGMPVPGNGTTLYGTKTESTVKKFQKKYGLIINGIADEVTLAKIYELKDKPLAKGMRRDDVKQLKKNLAKLGFTVPGNGTNYFGKNTEKKVEEFQKYFRLNVTGTLNQQTRNKIDSLLQSPLQKGERHQDTKQLKKDLAFLGMPVPGNGTTLYGTKTERTVKEFQKYYGLKVNGIADGVTLAKIESIISSPLQKGKRHSKTKTLKGNLAKIGYTVPGSGTAYYGVNTEKRVKQLQQEHGLIVNGIADEVTLNKIKDLVKKTGTKKVVFVDAGHGGIDPGASGNGLQEKNITLDIAKRVQKQLKAAGYYVVMSRTIDTYISLSNRTKQANKIKADIFVSIHVNSFNGNVSGIETWKMNMGPKPRRSTALANSIQNALINQTKAINRGVKNGNLHVNRESKMPSALLEVGFIDNKSDAKKLKKASYKNKITKGIVNGIKEYFKVH